ncbi:MAG: N-acetylmuramoyl-L-alanine amidase [Phycisphaerae bacterium]|nr:N-acetylmuramoyl-L-alanine amidase [Phycisphaerae bacterium]
MRLFGNRQRIVLVALVATWLGSLVVVAAVARSCRPAPLPSYEHLELDPLHTPATAYDWTRPPEPAFPIPPYAQYLSGVKIVIDPGHGGRAYKRGWKIGPTGLREAEVNLGVALHLAEFLRAAGADVTMTRDKDVYLAKDEGDDLRQRPEIANELGADLFLSLHHNASANNPNANRTEVYYHDSPDHSPASQDAGRHLVTGLEEALRLEQHLPCAVLCDRNNAPNSGYAVLRYCDGPAVLVESAFFTNPRQEQLLRDPVYQRREAYGLFLGLARWARGGLPRVGVIEPADRRVRPGGSVVVALDDGLSRRPQVQGHDKIRVDSIIVRLDGTPVATELDRDKWQIRVPIARDCRPGPHGLYVDLETILGHHVLRPNLTISIVRDWDLSQGRDSDPSRDREGAVVP